MTSKQDAPYEITPACGDQAAPEVVARPGPERFAHAGAFVEAAAALAGAEDDPESMRRLARVAGAALVGLGDLGASAALAEALRPDPREARVTFTVACYQIGDLVPCSLRDYRDPAGAVRALADCPQPSHVAAELLASTPSGLRWSALVRTGEDVAFQPPNGETASSASSAAPNSLLLALEGWSERLSRWEALVRTGRAAGGLLAEEPEPEPAAEATEPTALLMRVLSTVESLEGHLRAQRDLLGLLEGRLAALEGKVARPSPC